MGFSKVTPAFPLTNNCLAVTSVPIPCTSDGVFILTTPSANTVTVGVDILNQWSGSVGYEKSALKQITYVHNTPQIEHLEINTAHLTLRSTDLANVSGNIQKTDIISEQDVSCAKSQSVHLGSDGQLSYLTQSKHNQSEHHLSVNMEVWPSTNDVFQIASVSVGGNHQPDITFTLPIVHLEALSTFRDNLHWAWNQTFPEFPKTTFFRDPAAISYCTMHVPHREQHLNSVLPMHVPDREQHVHSVTPLRKEGNHHLHDLAANNYKMEHPSQNLLTPMYNQKRKLNSYMPIGKQTNTDPNNLTEPTGFSAYDPLLTLINGLSTPAFATEVFDPMTVNVLYRGKNNFPNTLRGNSREHNSEDFALFSGLSTLASVAAVHDRSILKEAYSTFQSY